MKFDDHRAEYEEKARNEADSARAMRYTEWSAQPEASIQVAWVRWVPEAGIPIARFFAKYGRPDVSSFAEQDMQPYRAWTARGIEALLTDDERFVIRIDFSFTSADMRRAWRAKYNYVPPFLQLTPPTHNRKARAK